MEMLPDDQADWIKLADLESIADVDDKVKECRYFLTLMEKESDRARFRWLTSAFLGAAYSFFEISALSTYFSFWDPHTGDPIQSDDALGVLRQYVAVLQDAKRKSYVKTKGVHPVTAL